MTTHNDNPPFSWDAETPDEVILLRSELEVANNTIADLKYKANYDGKTAQIWASENTTLRTEIDRLRGLMADLADEG